MLRLCRRLLFSTSDVSLANQPSSPRRLADAATISCISCTASVGDVALHRCVCLRRMWRICLQLLVYQAIYPPTHPSIYLEAWINRRSGPLPEETSAEEMTRKWSRPEVLRNPGWGPGSSKSVLYINIYIYIYIYIYVRVYIYIYIYIYICVYIYIYIYIYTHTCIYIYIYIHIYIYIEREREIHIHIHIYIYILFWIPPCLLRS